MLANASKSLYEITLLILLKAILKERHGKPLKAVTRHVLGNHRSLNCSELVDELLEAYKELTSNMSLKIHLLHSN